MVYVSYIKINSTWLLLIVFVIIQAEMQSGSKLTSRQLCCLKVNLTLLSFSPILSFKMTDRDCKKIAFWALMMSP